MSKLSPVDLSGYELYAACETITDLDQLYSEMGMADETPPDAIPSGGGAKLALRDSKRKSKFS